MNVNTCEFERQHFPNLLDPKMLPFYGIFVNHGCNPDSLKKKEKKKRLFSKNFNDRKLLLGQDGQYKWLDNSGLVPSLLGFV